VDSADADADTDANTMSQCINTEVIGNVMAATQAIKK
jgi:hypothetical protein